MIKHTQIFLAIILLSISCIHETNINMKENNIDIKILNIGDNNPNNKNYTIYVNESILFKKYPFNYMTIKQKAGITESNYNVELCNEMIKDPVEADCEKCCLLCYTVKNDTVRSFAIYDYNDKEFYEKNRKVWIPFFDCSECVETKRNW